jgi:hypothetical protein
MEESMERNRNWKRVIIVREGERAVFLLFWEVGTKLFSCCSLAGIFCHINKVTTISVEIPIFS